MSITEKINELLNGQGKAVNTGALRNVVNEDYRTTQVGDLKFHPWAVSFAEQYTSDPICQYALSVSVDKILNSISVPVTHPRYPVVFAYMFFKPTFDAKTGRTVMPRPSILDIGRFGRIFKSVTGLDLPEDWWDQVSEPGQKYDWTGVGGVDSPYMNEDEEMQIQHKVPKVDYDAIRSRAAKKAWETRIQNDIREALSGERYDDNGWEIVEDEEDINAYKEVVATMSRSRAAKQAWETRRRNKELGYGNK